MLSFLPMPARLASKLWLSLSLKIYDFQLCIASLTSQCTCTYALAKVKNGLTLKSQSHTHMRSVGIVIIQTACLGCREGISNFCMVIELTYMHPGHKTHLLFLSKTHLHKSASPRHWPEQQISQKNHTAHMCYKPYVWMQE